MDSVRDIKIIKNELIKKDIDTVENRIEDFGRKAKRSQDKSVKFHYEVLLKVASILKESK